MFVRRVIVLLLILTMFYAAWQGIHVLLEAFAGLLFGVFLHGLSDRLRQRTGLRYGWALTLVTVGLFVVAGAASWLLWNRVAEQVGEMTQKLPESLAQVRNYLSEYAWGKLLLEQVPKTTESLTEHVGQFTQVTGLVAGVARFLEAVIIILIVGIFGAAEPGLYRAGVLHLVPPDNRGRAEEALDAIMFNLRWWLMGQAVLMVLMAITTTLGLWLIGVPFALALGLIAGMLEIVPYIGAWMSALPAFLMALLVGPSEVVMTLGLYLGLHVLEGYVLVPLIQRRAVELPPALTLVMQFLLGELLGFLGLLVAAPLTVVLVILVKMLYVEDALGDENVDVPGEPGNAEKPAVHEEQR
jgi:predicted PurR-regulated permease PerM